MRRLVTLALAAVLLAAGVGVNELNDRRTPRSQYPVPIEIGEDAEIGPLILHIREVAAVENLGTWDEQLGEGTVTVHTDFVWLVVGYSFSAVHSEISPGDVFVVDSQGRRYGEADRAFAYTQLAVPGQWKAGYVIVEVPHDALGELTILWHPRLRFVEYPAPYAQLTTTVVEIEDRFVDPRYNETLSADER